MPHPLQEKFQILVPYKEEGNPDEQWASFESSRDMRGQHARPDLNVMPSGMVFSPEHTEINCQPLVMSGESDVSVTKPANWDKGFTTLEMKGSDDCYTGEHVDLFYGDSGGFVERNNYLDRL
jgi:hypothetical protein